MDLRVIEKFVNRQKVSFICSIDENGFRSEERRVGKEC